MDIFSAVLGVLETSAVLAAAIFAWRGLSTWQHETRAKRRAELAEEVLATFFEARDLLSAARSPGSFGGEGSTRAREPGESPTESGYLDSLYAPAERITRQSDFWARFDASRYAFMAVFGKEMEAHFDTIRSARNRVLLSVRMLIRTHDRRDERREEIRRQRERWEADIGWGDGETDELGDKVNAAVLTIESICRSAIQIAYKN